MNIDDNRMAVSLKIDKNGNIKDVDNISSIHPKDVMTEMERLSKLNEKELTEAMQLVNRKKVSDWFDAAGLFRLMHNENQKLISTAKLILNSDVAKEFDKIFDADSRVIDTEILAKINNKNEDINNEDVRFAIIENGIGRSLTADEAMYVISNMEKKAIYPVRIELTEQNWLKEFEETGIISTPIGDVKFGDNQFSKMNQKDRITKLGMIKPTLQNPDFIVEDKRLPKDGSVPDRETALVFVKSFLKEDGSRLYYFASVTVKKGNNEVIISNQEKSKSRIKRLLVNGKLAYINNSTLPSESNTSTQGDKPVNHVGGISAGKGTTNSRADQTNSEKNSENLQSGEDVAFSISAEQDREYMAAVESGDMEKAGAMVKAAFKARFPWVSAPVSLTLSKKLSETFVHFKILLYLCNA